jgi:hypothetical protein
MDFEESAIAYGARAGYAESGVLAASAGYAEIWRRGVLGSRTVDVAATWDPGPLRFEGGVKLDVARLGVVQARVGVAAQLARELSVDADYLHLEPGRWIPTWSILSVFETSTFDETSVGATVRPVRMLAIRAELAGRLYSNEIPGDARVGYRAELTARLAPDDSDTAARVLVSRRDDGVIGYTVLSAGTAFDLVDMLSLAIDGAFAIDDAAQRVSAIGRGSLELSPDEEWAVGGTVALAHTAQSEAELRAMLRLRWSPEVR